jgi:hypothetical protein
VDSHDDCDDRDKLFFPGVSVCATTTQSKSCPSSGTTSYTPCDYGCVGAGICHPASDGTIGLPGYVSCTEAHSPECSTSEGCILDDGTCGATSSSFHLYCDGPNDCPGQVCCLESIRGLTESKCYAGGCPESYFSVVCDPLASTCNCVKSSSFPIYSCQ